MFRAEAVSGSSSVSINSHRNLRRGENLLQCAGNTGQPPHSSAHAAVLHIIGNFFAYFRQFEEFLFSQGIFLLLCQFEISGSLFPQIVRVFVHRCSSFSVSSPPIIGETRIAVWPGLYRVVSRVRVTWWSAKISFDSGFCVRALHTKLPVL